MKHVFILNEGPYGSERSYNGLRLALAILKQDPEPDLTIFLMSDAVGCAKRDQKTPDGYYNIERMLKRILGAKGRVLVCGTCMDARGLQQEELMEGAERSTMVELSEQTLAAEKTFVF